MADKTFADVKKLWPLAVGGALLWWMSQQPSTTTPPPGSGRTPDAPTNPFGNFRASIS